MPEITLKVNGLKIRGELHLPAEGSPPFPGVILCHGLPTGAPPDPTDGGYPLLARQLAEQGMAALAFSFRGCYSSEGNFDIAGWSRDLEGAIDYLWSLEELDDSRLALLGFSAGAAVSVYVGAADKRVSAVAACACPSDFSSIYQAEKPQQTLDYFRKIGILREPGFPPYPEEWLNGFRRINALHSVGEIAPRPLLLLHGSADNVVPPEHSRRLYARAGQPKNLVIMEGDGHRLRRSQPALRVVFAWLRQRLLGEPPEAGYSLKFD
jgi:fermentation-respiration switch protein FrsA (DUF1100 family)